MRTPILFSALALCFSSCTSPSPKADFSNDSFLEHVKVLSSDEFQGRAPATVGEEKTIDYLIRHFKKYDLKPAFGESFIQNVPVSAYKVNKQATGIQWKSNKAEASLSFLSDVMVWPSGKTEIVDFNGLELVYVGYGIQAEEENWDDYKELDVTGKVLVFKNSDPYSNPDRFKGNARLFYGRYEYKYEIAAKLKAKGALIVHTTPTAGYPWAVVANSWEKEQFRLRGLAEHPETLFNGWVSLEASEKLFSASGLNLAELLEKAESPDFKPVPLQGIKLSGHIESTFRELDIKNAGAILPGSDKSKENEYLVVTAHHDHLGIGTPVRGDSIFNGALDNATGVSALLNLAQSLSQNQKHSPRSILFLAVSGEEKGLLGARYYAANPSIAPKNIVLNINLDGMNVAGKTRDLVSIGFGRSTVDGFLEAEATAQKRYVRPDPRPELGFFYRSDHFAFAKIGVPVLYTNTGRDFIDKPDDFFETTFSQYLNERYHSVFDEINAQWDVTGAVDDLYLLFNLALKVSSAEKPPVWNAGDEFEKARLESLKQ